MVGRVWRYSRSGGRISDSFSFLVAEERSLGRVMPR